MGLYTTITLPPIRTRFAPNVNKAILLSYVHDDPFMVSLSPLASLEGPTRRPSAWITKEIESVHADVLDSSPPKVYTIKDNMSRWMPGLPYDAAFVHHPNGSRVVVETKGARLWTSYEIEESEDGAVALVESTRVRTLKPAVNYVKNTCLSAHEHSSMKMKECVEAMKDRR